MADNIFGKKPDPSVNIFEVGSATSINVEPATSTASVKIDSKSSLTIFPSPLPGALQKGLRETPK